jgi:hypothetical protein
MNTGIQRLYKHESVEFTAVPNWVVRDPNYSPNAFRLLAYLLSHAQGYELTYAQIERQTTLGRYAINEAAKFLQGQGWLILKREKGNDGRWLAKTWIIKDPASTADDSIMGPFHYGTDSGHIEEQLLEKKTVKRKTLSDSDLKSLFKEFYSHYPRKSDPGAALRAFRSALNRASFEDILAGAIRYANDPNLPESRFIKHPSTWLNADAWENGPLPELKGKKKQTDWDALKRYAEESDAQD